MRNTDFYERNADAFYGDTVTTDMAPIYERFLPLVRLRGRILDAGCGSGRDSLAFLQRGYRVDAFDGSSEMVRRARALTGIEVRQLMFENLLDTPLQETYDGIWCCASLLHVERDRLPSVMDVLCHALAPDGIMYVSFKYGETARLKDGRRFTDLTEQGLDEILATIGGCELNDLWVTDDQRPGRADRWLNAIVRTI
ncbi:class I SAM-dependent methyltransferase [Massilia sp.]|uniref:class I SAM-dependent methyltransferase n=1 Tax=Massilia sp. TaxID=1882437 RepID=UPI0028AB38A0|nr:class I SAM-dependent methyltransferase [Massilia sp.]